MFYVESWGVTKKSHYEVSTECQRKLLVRLPLFHVKCIQPGYDQHLAECHSGVKCMQYAVNGRFTRGAVVQHTFIPGPLVLSYTSYYLTVGLVNADRQHRKDLARG